MQETDEAYKKKPAGRGLLVGLSAGGIGSALILIWHILHGVQLATESQEKNSIKIGSATIILRDSVTGKKDTMELGEYMKKKNNKDEHR